MNRILFLLLLFFVAIQATEHCVGPSATGDESGDDWNNMMVAPSSRIRGDTYYFADGTYDSLYFNDAESSTDTIFIVKATESAHGNETGWSSTYGDGVATFESSSNNVFYFGTGYYYVDGVSGGGPDNWMSGHGIKLNSVANAGAYICEFETGVDNITITRLEIDGNSASILGSGRSVFGDENKNIIVSYCYIHDSYKLLLQLNSIDTTVIEYNYIGPNGLVSYDTENSTHEAGIDFDFNVNMITIRYNHIVDISETGYITSVNAAVNSTSENWNIHGNVFYTLGVDTVENTQLISLGGTNGATRTLSNFKFYNNTINRYTYPDNGSRVGIYFNGINGGGNEVKNNMITHNSVNAIVWDSAIVAYNYYYDNVRPGVGSVDPTGEDNVQIGTVDLYVDTSTFDFSLTGATDAGDNTIGSDYNTDLTGSTRGNDGVWDRGAFEYNSSVNYDTAYIDLKLGE